MGAASSSLNKIRRDLDPEFSYILFERKMSEGSMEDIADLVKSLSIPVLEAKIHEDRRADRIFLVVKMDPERAKQISREYVSVSMPENVACLFYDSLIQDARKGVAGPARDDTRAQDQPKTRKRRRRYEQR